ncbi:MAG: Txe/YoeB family addiction module toxin [Prevotella sp.]|jgi:toxin YoeB|nr:Txe/YoeB family addiction module toxin [Prevotella sp.]
MEIKYSLKALEDIEYWKKSGNLSIMNKITRLMEEIAAHPFTGSGKPEPLKYELSGKWSRRINYEHRIIYSVNEDTIEIHVFSMR